ncbi:MAG: HPr kinase/phosphatase C-terminal domain-containing protein [Rhodospirillaceae bacterium]|nr:HPr kinase/phosphatase C-terminal domain-containing protein [Rhodospirillaceae bacterium]
MSLVHATCVALDDVGIVIRGASGAGKSDLALRLIDGGAALVADDYCHVAVDKGRLLVTPPANIAGQIEVRGYGIVKMPYRASIAAGLVVDLKAEADIERMPEHQTCIIEGVTLPCLAVNAFAASAVAKVRIVLQNLKAAS